MPANTMGGGGTHTDRTILASAYLTNTEHAVAGDPTRTTRIFDAIEALLDHMERERPLYPSLDWDCERWGISHSRPTRHLDD